MEEKKHQALLVLALCKLRKQASCRHPMQVTFLRMNTLLPTEIAAHEKFAFAPSSPLMPLRCYSFINLPSHPSINVPFPKKPSKLPCFLRSICSSRSQSPAMHHFGYHANAVAASCCKGTSHEHSLHSLAASACASLALLGLDVILYPSALARS